jgi:hypothetical protein
VFILERRFTSKPFDGVREIAVRILTSISRLGPTQRAIQMVPGARYPGLKRQELEDNRSFLSTALVKKRVEIYLHYCVRLKGVVLS